MPRQHIQDTLRTFFAETPKPARLGIALSGGGDSMALMHGLAGCLDPGGPRLFAATVDHGVRAGSAAEAASAGRAAAALGIAHETLVWDAPEGAGNLQDRARRARYRLLADWARRNRLDMVALGHTADDQAETFLMRLARSSGVDGLAAMAVRFEQGGTNFVRPLLRLTRAELREFLAGQGVAWAEDPSNTDTRFDRVKARAAMAELSTLGITGQTLSDVAGHLGAARTALEAATASAARDCAEIDAGQVVFDAAGFWSQSPEITRRLLIRAVCWVAGAEYPPRRAPVAACLKSASEGRASTLAGCCVQPHRGRIHVCRELNALAGQRAKPGQAWDGRWRVIAPEDIEKADKYEILPLGEPGLSQCPDWRVAGHPAPVLAATPAVWKAGHLIAAPLAGAPRGWRAEPLFDKDTFFAAVLSH